MDTVCSICPRKCAAVRSESEGRGVCRSPADIMIARAAPHYGEEPCISGTAGSGAVFFTGCNLHCVFCQNYEISIGKGGKPVSVEGLRDIFLRLQDLGVHNINLVTPTHYSTQISKALSIAKLKIPVVWNSSGYDSVEQLRELEGLVQIYMPDFKYSDPRLAARYSHAPDYPEIALAAVIEMYRQVGPFQMDNEGILQHGLLVRHLVMPGSPENTLRVMDLLEDNLPVGNILFSLMGQYTPMPVPDIFPELKRTVTPEEYNRCLSYLDFSEIKNGYTQSLDSATGEMIPDFDGTGV